MEQVGDRLIIHYTDKAIDALLSEPTPSLPYRLHFSHNEEMFLKMGGEISVPVFSIHHDVTLKVPDAARIQGQMEVIRQIKRQLSGLLGGFRYFFDATEIMKLCFFQFMKAEEDYYLVLLRIDLTPRPAVMTIVAAGSNDRTAAYRTDQLYLEIDILPVREVQGNGNPGFEMRIQQSVSDTWIGETGRGYFVQGIWLDRDITKFFSRLFLPAGKRLYPYYPVNCKFRAICFQPFNLEPEGRRKAVAALHCCRRMLEPLVGSIEQALHGAAFSEDLPLFQELRARTPPSIPALFEGLSMRTYLNTNDLKEYELSYETK